MYAFYRVSEVFVLGSYDNDLLLFTLFDDDLFFVQFVKEATAEDVERIQPEPFSKARR